MAWYGYVRIRNEMRELKMSKLRNRIGKKTSQRISKIPNIAKQTFEQHMRSLVSIARGGGAKVLLSTFATLHNPSINYSERDEITRLSRLQKIELNSLMHYTPGLNVKGIMDGVLQYNDIIRTIANDEKVTWVDSADLLPHEDAFFVDRVHFSSLGAASMAKNLFPVVLNILRNVRAKSGVL